MTLDEQRILSIAKSIEDQVLRDEYLAQICRDDQELRHRVLSQLDGPPETAFASTSDHLEQTQDVGVLRVAEGETIGRYKLLQKIGEGGFGIVFMAEQARPVRRKVAVKVIKPGMDSKEVVARFSAERQALAMMDHPNIAKVLDAGTTDSGNPYFVMELVKGIPITEYCDEHRLKTSQRLELFVKVCVAVQHAHQKGIIHRDIKPSNVLVTEHDGSPVPKVIDFGVAKAMNQQLTEQTVFTHFQQMIGTPVYMSPEQAALSGLDVDTRSDIYSLGVLLYELLTGTTPIRVEQLKKASYDEVRRIIREEEPPKPSSKVSTLGEDSERISHARMTDIRRLTYLVRGELDWIVMKALEKDRGRRYETANSFAEDIQRFLSNEAVTACPPSAFYRIKKSFQRNRAVALSTLLILGAMVVATAVSINMVGIANRERAAASDLRVEAEKKAEELQLVVSDLKVEIRERLLSSFLSGDVERCKEALKKARAAELPELTIRLYESQIWLLEGKPAQAMQTLTELSDESPAAVAMLAIAAITSGEMDPWYDATLKLRGLLKQNGRLSFEDKLFSAIALIDDDIELCQQLARSALDELDSPIVRLVNAQALAVAAHATRSEDLLLAGFEELEISEPYIADLAFARDVKLTMWHIATALGQATHFDIDPQEALRIWELNQRVPFHRVTVIRFLFEYDRNVALRKIRSVDEPSYGELMYYIPMLLEHEPPSEVQKYLRRVDGANSMRQLEWHRTRLDSLSSRLRDKSSLQLRQLIRDESDSFTRCQLLDSLAFVGSANDVIEAANGVTAPGVDYWYSHGVEAFFRGEIDEEELIDGAGTFTVKQAEAWFAIGCKRLGKGDKDAAVAAFDNCVATGAFHDENYYWARALRKSLSDDAVWEFELSAESEAE